MTDDFMWDIEADVVVLGSGGAAMTAAISAYDFGAKDVVILERSGMVGGTTAMSGGMLWIPGNHHQIEAGIEESEDDIVAYLDSLAPSALDPDTLGAFLESGPELIRYLADKTPVRFHAYADFPDYQPYMPGAKPDGGRSLDNDAFSFERLGKWATRVNPSKMAYPLRGSLMQALADEIADATPNGINMIFENVGGDVLDAGLMNLAMRARILLCGLISEYNSVDGKHGARNLWALIVKRATMQGFLIMDYVPQFGEGGMQVAQWMGEGKIRVDEDLQVGLENAYPAFMRLFSGANTGKLILKIAE